MDISFKKTNGPLDDLINELLSMADVHHPEIIREMVIRAIWLIRISEEVIPRRHAVLLSLVIL